MKKKLGMLLAVVLTFCMSAVVFADAGKTQQVDYKTDYYMIVESPDGGIDMYSEASVDSPKLNDELIPNGTAIHVEGESTDEAGKTWIYAQLHSVFGFLQEDYLKPATLSEAIASELALYGSTDVNYDITVNAKEDGSVSLYKGPGKKYGTISGGCNIANGEKLHIDTEVDTGKDGIWGKTEAGGVSGWVDIAQATNTEENSVELIPETDAEAQSAGDRVTEGSEEEKAEAGNASTQSEEEKADAKNAEPTSTPTPKPTSTSTPTPEPTSTTTPTPEPTETSTPTPEPTETSTPTPEPTETSTPTPEPTETSTPTPEPTETSTPAPEPTEMAADTGTAAPTDSADQEASSESVENTSNGMSPVIWVLIIVIIIGIAVVIWLIKRNSKKSE